MLSGKVALVTGATRGIGKGIALQLGEAGATVYITGRTMKASGGSIGSLEDTAKEIVSRGGKCVPVQVDHENDSQIQALFKKIEQEQNGRLDILVNNAYKAVDSIFTNSRLKFWEQKPEIWDDVNNVGLRNHYVCTVYASRLMVPRQQGLIVFTSSFGSMKYLFNVAYGIGKAAVDRMAMDCGVELRKHNVASISLMIGAVKTELVSKLQSEDPKLAKSSKGKQVKDMFDKGESIEFPGKCIVALAQDSNVMKYSGKVLIAEDYGQSHGLKDIDGKVVNSFRQLNYLLDRTLPSPLKFIAKFIPNFIKVPKFIITLLTSKF